MEIFLPKINHDLVKEEIIEFIQNKVDELGKSGVVVGISGGVDSAVVSAISKMAMDNSKQQISGLILPGNDFIENDSDTEDAIAHCKQFQIPYEYVSLKHLIDITEIKLTPEGINKVAKGNMASRIRSNIIHTYAELRNLLVCGTGNKDEDYGIGYYTLFGDGAVHISPIGNLSKRLVYEMASFLSISDSIIMKQPSARLEVGQTDFYDLGYGYDIVELVIEGLDAGYNLSAIGDCLQSKYRFLRFNQKKFKNIHDVVSDIMRRHKNALNKAKLVSPEIAPITLTY